LELYPLGNNPEQENFHPMTDLPEYMEWFLNNVEEE
jgi:hypothetical protein